MSALEIVGGFITAAWATAQVKAIIDWTTGTPSFFGYQTVAQSFASSTSTAPVLLDSEQWDSDGVHSTTTNTSRYTVQVAGKYLAIASVSFAANTTGLRAVAITQNGGGVAGARDITNTLSTSNVWVGQAVGITQCSVGDYLECAAFQTSGGSLSTSPGTGSAYMAALAVYWLST